MLLAGSAPSARGLFRIGVPKESIEDYEAAIKKHRLLLIAHGSSEQ